MTQTLTAAAAFLVVAQVVLVVRALLSPQKEYRVIPVRSDEGRRPRR